MAGGETDDRGGRERRRHHRRPLLCSSISQFRQQPSAAETSSSGPIPQDESKNRSRCMFTSYRSPASRYRPSRANSYHRLSWPEATTTSGSIKKWEGREALRNTSVEAGGMTTMLLGGLAVATKLAALLVTRVFCVKAWPFLQTISISALLLRKLTGKTKISELVEAVVKPLHSLAGPVLCLTIAKQVVRWCSPDAYRTLRFWRRLLPIYAGYMKTKWQVRKKSLEERDKAWAKRHEWGGEKVYELIIDMSGFYVKSAQILASKADFVPEAWTKYLSKLLDNAPPRPFHEVELSIGEQLACCPGASSWSDKKGLVPLDACFLEVEQVPLAAASIAQVHGGVLRNGSQVVIKVQHRGMEILMHSDLRNIVWLAKFLRRQLPVDLVPIVKEIQSTIPLEFNFEREVWFMNAIRKNLAANGFKQIVCPMPFTEFCSKRLIVMQRVDGVPFTQILHPASTKDLQSRIPEAIQAVEYLIEAYGQMFLVDGVFHADPHAGNLLLLSDGRLGLLDYGQSKVIDDKLRQNLARMILALCEDNELAIVRALLDIGIVFQPVDAANVPLSTVAIAARILFDVCYVKEATVSPMAQNSILRTIPLRKFNQALWMVVRTNLLLRGLCFSLKLDMSAAKIWRPYALTALQGS